MYKCDICGQTSKPRQAAYKVVIETRPVHYPERIFSQGLPRKKHNIGKYWMRHDPGGIGRECVKEITVCVKCLRISNTQEK